MHIRATSRAAGSAYKSLSCPIWEPWRFKFRASALGKAIKIRPFLHDADAHGLKRDMKSMNEVCDVETATKRCSTWPRRRSHVLTSHGDADPCRGEHLQEPLLGSQGSWWMNICPAASFDAFQAAQRR